jgi:hypothetical protein
MEFGGPLLDPFDGFVVEDGAGLMGRSVGPGAFGEGAGGVAVENLFSDAEFG